MVKVNISRDTARALGIAVGAAWLTACLAAMFWVLESILNLGITIYGLVYPLILALCVVAGFAGRAILSKCLSALVEIGNEPRIQNYFLGEQYSRVAKQIVVVATVAIGGQIVVGHAAVPAISSQSHTQTVVMIGAEVAPSSTKTIEAST